MIAQLAIIFGANFIFIGLRAFQQLNVMHNARALVFATSNMMAISEVYLVASYAHYGNAWPVVTTVGISGGLGCLFSMWLRKKLVKDKAAT